MPSKEEKQTVKEEANVVEEKNEKEEATSLTKEEEEASQETVKENDNKLIYSVGLAAINLSTGKNYVHSFVTLKQDPNMWKDETYRLMQYYNPSECIVHYGDDLKFTLSELSQMWDIDEHIIHNNTNSFPEIAKNSYQNESCYIHILLVHHQQQNHYQ